MERKEFKMKKVKLFCNVVLMLVILSCTAVCFADGEFVRGTLTTVSYDAYVNSELGIRCVVPDSYVMATEEEIEQIMAAGMDMIFKEDETGKQILDVSKITLLYEMMAVNNTDGSSVTVIAEKPVLSNMTLKQYIGANVSQISSLPMEISEPESGKEDFCGQELNYLSYSMNYQGVDVTQKMFFMESGDRFVIIQLSALDTDTINTMKGFFSEYHGE